LRWQSSAPLRHLLPINLRFSTGAGVPNSGTLINPTHRARAAAPPRAVSPPRRVGRTSQLLLCRRVRRAAGPLRCRHERRV